MAIFALSVKKIQFECCKAHRLEHPIIQIFERFRQIGKFGVASESCSLKIFNFNFIITKMGQQVSCKREKNVKIFNWGDSRSGTVLKVVK